MNWLKNHILMAVGFVVLAGIVSGITAGPAIAQAIKAVLVKNVDEHGRVPFMVTESCDTTTTNSCSIIIPGPLAGKRLVLEHISSFHTAANAMEFSAVQINTGATSFKDRAFINPKKIGVGAIASRYSSNEPLLVYVEAAEVINTSIYYTMNGSSSNTVTLSGYIVDLGI